MFEHPFLRYAFLAGTAIALASGLVGYFVVLRGQVFTGDALSHVAFTGALAALAAGIDLLLGLYGACVVVALAMAALGTRGRADDTVIGSVFAWISGSAPCSSRSTPRRRVAPMPAIGRQRPLRIHLRALELTGTHRRPGRRSPSPSRSSPSRGPCCSPASTRPWPRPAGCRSARSGSCSSGSWA